MEAFDQTERKQEFKIANTLPISCQICLGKVSQPVVCPNQHVFCAGCVETWLQRIPQCPTCRITISKEQPFRPILGGNNSQGDERSKFSCKDLRKTRVELLFKDYESELAHLDHQVKTLSRENEALHARLKQDLQASTNAISTASTAADNAVLKALTDKLEAMTMQYNGAKDEVEKVKKEKTSIEDKQVELHREIQRLRLELSSRSPRRFGRSTVTALESRVETYEKQIKQLEKALEKSDGHIEYLEGLLKGSNGSPGKEAKSKKDNDEKRKYETKTFEELPSTLSGISDIDAEDYGKLMAEDSTFDLEMPSPFSKQTKSANRLEVTVEESEGGENTLEDPSHVSNVKKKLRFADGAGDSMLEKPDNMKDNLNVSMTPELEDCMKILEAAEKKLTEREISPKSSEVEKKSQAPSSYFEPKKEVFTASSAFSKEAPGFQMPPMGPSLFSDSSSGLNKPTNSHASLPVAGVERSGQNRDGTFNFMQQRPNSVDVGVSHFPPGFAGSNTQPVGRPNYQTGSERSVGQNMNAGSQESGRISAPSSLGSDFLASRSSNATSQATAMGFNPGQQRYMAMNPMNNPMQFSQDLNPGLSGQHPNHGMRQQHNPYFQGSNPGPASRMATPQMMQNPHQRPPVSFNQNPANMNLRPTAGNSIRQSLAQDFNFQSSPMMSDFNGFHGASLSQPSSGMPFMPSSGFPPRMGRGMGDGSLSQPNF